MIPVVTHQIINRPQLLSYLKAGYLLHIITVIELLVLWIAFANMSLSPENSILIELIVKIGILVFFASLPFFGQLDAHSRYQNYKQIKDQFYLYGFDRRILKPALKSRCQRDAAQVAAEELGYGVLCRMHFRSFGYRWYHLIPDFVFHKPLFLISKHFWRTTFFTPIYSPRIDYRKMATRFSHSRVRESS
jgi:hypothetical protein